MSDNRTAAGQKIREWGISLLRTAVPVAWGYVLTWVATNVPAIADVVTRPEAVGFGAAITGALTVAWYALMRWAEPKLPAWLTVLVLGWNMAPKYGELPKPLDFTRSRTASYEPPTIPPQSDRM